MLIGRRSDPPPHLPLAHVPECRHPEVELQDPDLLPKPVLVTKGDRERCLVEGSTNSARVSFQLDQQHECRNSLQKVCAILATFEIPF